MWNGLGSRKVNILLSVLRDLRTLLDDRRQDPQGLSPAAERAVLARGAMDGGRLEPLAPLGPSACEETGPAAEEEAPLILQHN